MTNANASEGWKRYRLLPVVMALICVFLWGAMFARLADRQIGIDKDWVFLYLCGIEMVQPQLHEQQIDLVKKIVAASGDDQAVYRATMRANYCNNYLYTSLSMYLAGKVQTWFGTGPAEDFPGFVARSLWYGIVVSGEVLGILTLLVVFALTTGALRTSLCVSIGLAALFYLVIPPPITNWFLYQGTPSPPAMLVNWLNVLKLGLHSWFHPAGAFSAFSTFPRSLCAVLSFAAFAIRWSGRPVAAYWVPLLIGGVHQSTSLILLFALIGCDIVVRPGMLRRPAIILAIVVNLALIVLRERMFAILGFSSSEVVLATAILLCVIVALAMLRPVRVVVRAGWKSVAAWRDRTVAAVPLPFADALTIFAAWLAVILISYLASRNDAWYRLIYFWSELSPRYIGMFQLSFIAGIVFPLVLTMQTTRPLLDKRLAAAASVVMLGLAISQLVGQGVRLPDMLRHAPTLDKVTNEQRNVYVADKVPSMRDETGWYYLMVRNAILGDRSLTNFFGKP